MQQWIVKRLREVLANPDIAAVELESQLAGLVHRSLEMVAFLAAFSRQYGAAPRILDFIERPTLQTLEDSIKTLDSRREVQ